MRRGVKALLGRGSDTRERKSLPPELIPAPPGEYRFRSTGEVVVNPDLLAKWVINKPEPDSGSEPA